MKKKKLKDMNISHISLVKAGANGKSIIYKSVEEVPTYTKEIPFTKANEQGIIYGIVYSPDEVDTQGEFADADEIQKAAYKFMKAGNTLNIDKEHSFKKEDAFVCESWLVKKNDPIFPNEKEGSWAIGVKLLDEELKAAVKKGEIKALSMAGFATKEEIEKASATETKTAIAALLDIFKKLHISLDGFVEKNESKKDKGLIEEATKALNAFETENKKQKETLEALKKRIEELEGAIKKSKQTNEVGKSQTNNYKGLL